MSNILSKKPTVHRQQLGFAPLTAILIIVVLIVAGGAGYYFYKTSQEEKEAEKVEPEQVVDETADWEIYQNKIIGYELKYPKDWTRVKRLVRKEYVQFSSPLINNKYYLGLNFGVRNKGDNTQISYQSDEDWELLKSFMRLGDEVKIGNVDVLTTEIVEKGRVHTILYSDRLGAGRIEISGLEIQASLDIIEGPQHLSVSDVESIDLKNLLELKLANQILSTFKVLEPDETADWEVYQNEKYGFSFSCPKNFQLLESDFTRGSLLASTYIEDPTLFSLILLQDKYIDSAQTPLISLDVVKTNKTIEQLLDCIRKVINEQAKVLENPGAPYHGALPPEIKSVETVIIGDLEMTKVVHYMGPGAPNPIFLEYYIVHPDYMFVFSANYGDPCGCSDCGTIEKETLPKILSTFKFIEK